jgi:hypothetical protein
MNYLQSFIEASESLLANKMRSGLTVLGIIIDPGGDPGRRHEPALCYTWRLRRCQQSQAVNPIRFRSISRPFLCTFHCWGRPGAERSRRNDLRG